MTEEIMSIWHFRVMATSRVFLDETVAKAFKRLSQEQELSEQDLEEAANLLVAHRPELAKKILPYGV